MVDDFLHDFGVSVKRILENMSCDELEVMMPTLTTNIGRYLHKFAVNSGVDKMVSSTF